MVLIIREKATGQIHKINHYGAYGPAHIVHSSTWPGDHTIGEDCEWVPMTDEEWSWISYIKDNPGETIKEISEELKIHYITIYRMVQLYKLTVRVERKRGEGKKKEYWSKYLRRKK